MWLAATRASTAPGRAVSRRTPSPVVDRGKRARGGDAQRVHRLADQVFAQHRAERRLAVAAAREGRGPGPLQRDVAALPVAVDHLAQQQRAAVAKLREKPPNWCPA